MSLGQLSILVTGANGFVGSRLCVVAAQEGWCVHRAVRRISGLHNEVVVSTQGNKIDWSEALGNSEVVIHLAARVHVMDESAANPLDEFRHVNVAGTLNLARQAAEAAIKRFIFISSIKVNGEETQLDQPFNEDDSLIPTDPYALSKYEAEQGLLKLAKETGMEVVIIRPPLVYGPGVKANFASMMKWVTKGVPLPFGSIHNQRSFVALDNLVSFIIHCIEHPKAANEVFLISDGEDVSTTELLRKVASAFEVKSTLLPVPVSLMTVAANILGKGDMANRLFGSLQVDISKAKNMLGWHPVITMDAQLKKIADAYLEYEKTL